jgi:hypothetical protein
MSHTTAARRGLSLAEVKPGQYRIAELVPWSTGSVLARLEGENSRIALLQREEGGRLVAQVFPLRWEEFSPVQYHEHPARQPAGESAADLHELLGRVMGEAPPTWAVASWSDAVQEEVRRWGAAMEAWATEGADRHQVPRQPAVVRQWEELLDRQP